MNNWGITKRELRTDADLEEAVVDIHEDQSQVVQDLDITDHEIINEQLETMKDAPGKQSYEEWMQSEFKKDEECLNRILSNKAVQKTLSERYHTIVPQANQTVQTIPTEVFLNFNVDDEDLMNKDTVHVGNLSKYW